MLESICNRSNNFPRAAALGLALALPAALWAGTTIKVPRPNGVDDTANLQAALDAGKGAGPGAIVQLAAGTYRTKQLYVKNFQGAFRGAGQGSTTIVAKPHLTVTVPDFWPDQVPWPLPPTCQWPVLITFVNGDIHVSDLTIKVPAANGTATTGWLNPTFEWQTVPEQGLYDVILFTGDSPTNAVVERVTMEGVLDSSWWGSNIAMGVDYSAYCPLSSTPGDYAWLSGNYTVRNCTFKNMFNAISFDGRHQDCQVVIGGSPGCGNVGVNLEEGIDLELAQGSMFEVSFNQMTANWVGLWEIDSYSVGLGGFSPATPSYFFIHDNTFTVLGAPWDSDFRGILIENDDANPWIRAAIYNNRIAMRAQPSDAIRVGGTKGISIRDNIFTGVGTDAINLANFTLADGVTQAGNALATIDDNDFSGFTASTFDVVLDTSSSDSRVTLNSTRNTWTDLGINNVVSVLPPANNQNQQ